MHDYQQQAEQTKSNQFHGELVNLEHFKTVVLDAMIALDKLDKIKKAIFYGKRVDAVQSSDPKGFTCEFIADTFEENGVDILHSIIGKATEAGELLELMFNTIEGVKFDAVNFREEIGDGMWYDAIGLTAVGSDIATEQQTNIAKLRARFPNKFTEYDANNRDLAIERKILEG